MAEKKEKTATQKITDVEIARAKKEIADQLRKDYELTDEQIEEFFQASEEANQPIKLNDEEFELGARELDVRNLNQSNLAQIFFRTQVQEIASLRAINKSLIDLMRLFMVLLDHLGIVNITKAVDDILVKLAKQNKDALSAALPKDTTKTNKN